MGNLSCMTAMCQCTFGVAPAPLVVSSNQTVMAGNMPAATISDNTPGNLPTFGMCSSMSNPTVASATAAAMGVLTPMPCVPVLTAPWAPGCATVLIGGKPALNDSSQLMCAYGGSISIKNPGQQTVQVP